MFKILGSALTQFYMRMLGEQNLFVEKTAEEFMWGYEDPILTLLELLGLTEHPLMRAQVCSCIHNFIY